MEKEPIIRLSGITVAFDGEQVLKNFDLSIRDGEFVTLLGPSGCGKTTTLRAIAGFVKPESGDIFFNGKNINDLPPHKREVNTIFQRYALFPHLNVYENVAFGLRVSHTPDKEVRQRVAEMLKMVNLTGYEKRKVDKLSGGQQQRVLLARALCATRKMLLLDEPVSGLDPKATAEMYALIEELNRNDGITVIMISHDITAAVQYASHLLHIGDTVFFGTKAEYLRSPQGRLFAAEKGGDAQ